MTEMRPDAEKPAPTAPAAGLIERLRGVWRDVAGQLGLPPSLAPDLPPDDADALRERMRDCLSGKGGDVSARARAAMLGRSYLGLDSEGRRRFLRILADEFGTDPARIDAAMAAVLESRRPVERLARERALRETLESPRIRLLAQFNGLPEGVKFLVDLRAEMMALADGDPAISALEGELRELLAGWFDVGFLELHRITWRSPALVLEKITNYEAVHAIQSWHDLKNRLDPDRRFFAFFHPRMPDEPLIFVEVALVRGMAANIHELLDETAPLGDPGRANAAIFYAITSAQKGLAGISFGNFLIKRVVDDLSREFPRLKTFATLSPVPGFRSWLAARLREGDPLAPAERRTLASAGAADGLAPALARPWQTDPGLAEALRAPLMRLCAQYLLTMRDPSRENGGGALDPVARFHLANGARMERLNWMGDLSDKGIAQSAGMMVNYEYRLDDIDENHEAYSGHGRIVASSAIRALTKS